MTSSTSRVVPPAAASGNGHRGQRVATPLPTRQHPRGYVALAVALIVGLGALGYWFYTQAGAKVPVVMVVHDVSAGHTVQRSDLTVVEVSGAVTAIAGDHLSSVVGETATVEILPNTLLQRAMVTAAAPLPANEAIVGVAVSPGQLPSVGVADGDAVQVLQLADKSATGSVGRPTVLVDKATVWDVRPNPSTSGGMLVSLLVLRTDAAAIAAASNAGLIALVRVGG